MPFNVHSAVILLETLMVYLFPTLGVRM